MMMQKIQKQFMYPSRPDARPMNYDEKTCLLHLTNQTTLLVDAQADLAERMKMIEGGPEMLKTVAEVSEKLLTEVRKTIPEKQRRTLNNVNLDYEMRLVPKMTPTSGKVLVHEDDFRQLVDAARHKCTDCADTPEEAQKCKLYQLFLNILPLERYDTILCPYNEAEWRGK